MQAAADGGGGGPQIGGFFESVNSGMDSLGQQMRDFAESAKQDQFSVNDAGGKALLGAIQDMQQWLVGELRDQSRQMQESHQYGTTHGAAVVEPYMNNVLYDSDGLMTALEKFQTVLNDAEEAIHKAMENYQQSDADAKASLPETGGDVSLPPGAARATPVPYTPQADPNGANVYNI